MPRVCFKPINHVIHWNSPREGIFLMWRQWLFRTTWSSFTTCLSSRGKLTVVFVCHRTVSMVAVYQLKINYDQDKFGMFFIHAKRFPLEDKHLVNRHDERHVARKKSWRHTEKMPSSGAFQCTTWLVWSELTASKTLLWRRQKIRGCRGLLGRVIFRKFADKHVTQSRCCFTSAHFRCF